MSQSEGCKLIATLTMMGCLGYQSFLYLMHGTWPAFSLIDLALWAFPKGPWLNSPDSWIGVHKILDFINAGIGMSAIFYAMALGLEAEGQ